MSKSGPNKYVLGFPRPQNFKALSRAVGPVLQWPVKLKTAPSLCLGTPGPLDCRPATLGEVGSLVLIHIALRKVT